MPQIPQHNGQDSTPHAGSPATGAPASASLSGRATRVIGFCVGGAALVILADYAPQAAIGTTVVIGLGVALTHASDIRQISNTFITATGGKALPAV